MIMGGASALTDSLSGILIRPIGHTMAVAIQCYRHPEITRERIKQEIRFLKRMVADIEKTKKDFPDDFDMYARFIARQEELELIIDQLNLKKNGL
jgi:hypothetical protein